MDNLWINVKVFFRYLHFSRIFPSERLILGYHHLWKPPYEVTIGGILFVFAIQDHIQVMRCAGHSPWLNRIVQVSAMPNKNPFPWVPRGWVNAVFPWLRWSLMWFYTFTYRTLSLLPSLRDRSAAPLATLADRQLLACGSCVSVNIGRGIPKQRVKEA